MTEETVLYTDGHGIKVTPYHCIIGKKEYLISGILRARMLIISPNKILPVVLLILGAAGLVAGIMKVFPTSTVNALTAAQSTMPANQAAMIAGGVLLFIGIIWLVVAHTKYSVCITTAEGDKDILTSEKKDYVMQIVNALNEAPRSGIVL